MSLNYVFRRGPPTGMGSMPMNPKCAVCTGGCSEALVGDVCVWHRDRMGTLIKVNCGCKSNPCVDGDSPGRMMRRNYEIKKASARDETLTYSDFAVIDTAGHFHCCGSSQNGDTDIAQCGDMRVCVDCAPKHSKLVYYEKQDSDDDDDDDDDDHYEEYPDHRFDKVPEQKKPEWPHRAAYSSAIATRQYEKKKVMTCIIEPTGPTCSFFKDGQLKTVNSVFSVMEIARDSKSVEDLEWWIWFAGWCPDCPANLRKY